MPPDVDLVTRMEAVMRMRNSRHELLADNRLRLDVETIAQEGGMRHPRNVAARAWRAIQVSGLRANADIVEPVDRAQKAGGEARGGREIDLLGGADLFDAPLVHQRDAIGHGEGLLLIVGHHQKCDANSALQRFQLEPYFLA